MPNVDLVYDRDCPNVAAARGSLMKAFAQSGLTPKWSEHLIGDALAPAYTRGFGSPTILVDHRDVSEATPGADACCRLYASNDGGVVGYPSVDRIAAALGLARAAEPPTASRARWKSILAVLPGVGAALLPKVACPACWPAYAGFLTSIGLGLLMETAWLLPLTAAFLAFAVGALAFRARTRRGFAPFGVGMIAAMVVLVGKFAFNNDPAMYAGIGLLVAASLWNTWPRRRIESCGACVQLREGETAS